jgi:hypothetical protein
MPQFRGDKLSLLARRLTLTDKTYSRSARRQRARAKKGEFRVRRQKSTSEPLR